MNSCGEVVYIPPREESSSSQSGSSSHDPPDNPNDPQYLKTCYVCQEPAKPDQPHTPHYGGITCLSCRAFFRRAHQGVTHPQFICKYNGRCVVSVKTRRRCQKCRYLRCLRAGMTSEGVLSESQKKIRFRKLILKRKHLGEPLPKFVAKGIDDDLDGEEEHGVQSEVQIVQESIRRKQPQIPAVNLSRLSNFIFFNFKDD